MLNPNYTIRILLICFFFISSNAISQEKTYKPEGSFSVDIGIPANGKNYSFGRIMEGLFNGGVSYKYNVYGGLTLGAGLKYSFFTINSFALNNADWGGGLHMPAVTGSVGYEKFTTERISLNGTLRFGYSYLISANDSCKSIMGKPYVAPAFFIEPQIEIILLTGKNSPDGFSFVIGYPMYFVDFGPEFLCMDKFPALIDDDYEGITRFLSIGFGYRFYMGRK